MHTIHNLTNFLEDTWVFCSLLQQETIIIYPTDTVYGIWSIITKQTAQRIATIKQRPASKRFSILVPSFERIDEHTSLSTRSEQLWSDYSQTYNTNTLTLLLPVKKTSSFPWDAISDSPVIWCRHLGDHPIQALVTALWAPIITTSCNISWQQPITTAHQAVEQFGDLDLVIIDWWPCLWSPSTIIEYRTWARVR